MFQTKNKFEFFYIKYEISVFSGPLISPAAKEKVERLITSAEAAGADILLDGRNLNVSFDDVFEVSQLHVKSQVE